MDRNNVSNLMRGAAFALLCSLTTCAGRGSAADLDLRLHVTWGGGERCLWQGSIAVSAGTCKPLRNLGIESDAPSAAESQDRGFRFWEHNPVAFDGFELQVSAPDGAQLVVSMSADGSSGAPERFEIPLAPFAEQPDATHKSALGDRQNLLLVRRAPGDVLRVAYDREHLVFAPREMFSFRLLPHAIGVPPETSLRASVQLLLSGGNEELWREQFEFRVREDGEADAVGPVDILLPAQEGVYNVVISVSQRRFPEAIGAIVPGKQLLQRKIQLVVLDSRPTASEPGDWREVDVMELTSREWWARWTLLPQLKKLRGMDQIPLGLGHSPLGSTPLETATHAGQKLTKLAGRGWYAAPIPIARIGQPHLLEVEYPNDVGQTLGISVLDPNAAGQLTPVGLDSGVDVSDRPQPPEKKLEKHRLVFWPRSKTPWLLLTNRREDAPAVFGKIRVLAGPEHLPPVPFAAAKADERLLAVYYDRPLFAENFSAAEALDESSKRSLDDWNTFYSGGRRLVEYLRYAGYNAAILSVMRDGASIYPSPLVEVTPKYDTGTFFVSGQDPGQKDVLEMLFRLFDREGLRLIPAIHLAFPLPELRERMRQEGRDAEGIELIGCPAGATRPTVGSQLAQRGQAPYYNPLDERVQAAVARVVEELASRYAHHSSFVGICLQLGAESYLVLPDNDWPCDDRTIDRFQREAQVQVPGSGADRYRQRSLYLAGEGRQSWSSWRTAELARFYTRLQKQVAAVRPTARLYLATEGLLAGRPAQLELRPRLLARPDVAQVLLRHGIDPAARGADDPIVLLRPARTAPLTSLVAQSVNLETYRSSAVDACFRNGACRGALNYREPLTLRLPEFDDQSPFGKENSFTWLSANVAPAGSQTRAHFVHGLAALDSQVLVEGGWMPSLGQEESLRGPFQVYRQLPATDFRTVEPESPSAKGAGVVVRTLASGDRTFLYVVNDSPWGTVVNLDLTGAAQSRIQSLSAQPLPEPTHQDGSSSWTLELEPYDLLGAVFSTPNLVVKDWRVSHDQQVARGLLAQLDEVRSRVNELRNPQPLDSLENADFESPAESDIPGWTYSQRPGVSIRTDATAAKNGKQCLHLRVDDTQSVAWVRSKPFPPPRTGRIFVLAWIRTRDARQQPPLRLAVDGLVNGEPYYRFAPLGTDVDSQTRRATGQPAQPLSEQWSERPFLLPIDDLPSTGLSELLVGFDLMGPGEVWIDDVRVFDVYFQVNEQDELLKKAAMADYQLENGRFADCAAYLDGYWPRFLLEFVPVSAHLVKVDNTAGSPAASESDDNPATESPPAGSGWRRFLPRMPFRHSEQRRNPRPR